MTDDNDFRDDLVSLLVNGMRIDWMNLKDSLDVIDFTVSLKEHYMKDLKLSHLFFWTDDNVILRCHAAMWSVFGGNGIAFLLLLLKQQTKNLKQG